MEFVDANTYNCAITRLLFLKKSLFFTHFDDNKVQKLDKISFNILEKRKKYEPS